MALASERPTLIGEKKIAVITVEFPEDGKPAHSVSSIREAIGGAGRSLSSFYSEQGAGRTSFGGFDDPAGDVFGPFSIPEAVLGGDCDYRALMGAALRKARPEGFNPDRYDNYGVVFTGQYQCSSQGYGDIHGRQFWLQGSDPGLMIHEIGHNYGADHANGLDCQIPIRLSDCDSFEYGDPFDPMGLGLGFMSGYNRLFMGQLPLQQVAVGARSGTVKLRIADDFSVADGEPRILMVPRRVGGVIRSYLEVEMTSPVDWLGNRGAPGAAIRLVKELKPSCAKEGPGPTELVPMRSGPGLSDSQTYLLGAGDEWTDLESGAGIRIESMDGDGIEVAVKSSSGTDRIPPRPPSFRLGCGDDLRGASFDGKRVLLRWKAAEAWEDGWDPDAPNWGTWEDDGTATTHEVRRNGRVVWRGPGSEFSDSSWRGLREAVYKVYAIDETGNRSAPAVSRRFRFAVGPGPGRPTRLKLRPKGRAARGGWILTWKRPERADGVRSYIVYRGSKPIGRPTRTRYRISNPHQGWSTIKLGVVAVSKSGKRSPKATKRFSLDELRSGRLIGAAR